MIEITDEIRKALAVVAETQAAFWAALSDLENLTETDLEAATDYADIVDADDATLQAVLGMEDEDEPEDE